MVEKLVTEVTKRRGGVMLGVQLCRRSNGSRRDPDAGRRPAAGDHKGAQPPYQVEKRPQGVFFNLSFLILASETVYFLILKEGPPSEQQRGK